MPVPVPQHYHWLARTLSSREPLEVPVTPPEPDPSTQSPEHMLLSSIGECLLTTFEAFAARDRIDLVGWEARVGGMVEKTDNGLEFTRYRVEIEMEVGDPDRARVTLEDAKEHCLVVNALRAPVDIDAKIRRAARKAG